MATRVLKQLRKPMDWYLSIGLADLPDSEKSRRFAFNVILLIGLATGVGYAAFYALYVLEGLRAGWVASLICVVLTLVTPGVAILSLRLALYVAVGVGIWAFMYMTYHMGTATGLFFFLSIFLAGSFIVNGRENLLDTLIIWLALTVAMVISVLFFQEPSGVARVDAYFQQVVLVGVVIGVSLMQGMGVLVLSFRVARAEQALAAEHERSEALLRNLLPAEIATRLKAAPGVVIADDLPEVTILFADIVGFTQRASTMPPDDLVRYLNGVFTEFDILTERYGLEKVKTIGDAYMVAAGMPVAREDHAQVAADMALDMLNATARLSTQTGQQVDVRIGLHSGSAVAGVIGTKKVFYDIWGDTVNTASRMESGGEKGRIQVTQDTKDRLGDTYVFEDRPMTTVKGKGLMQTYWLLGKAG